MLKDMINGIIQDKKSELEAKYEANKDEIHAEGEKIKNKLKKIGIISGFVIAGFAVLLAIGLFTEPEIETVPESKEITVEPELSDEEKWDNQMKEWREILREEGFDIEEPEQQEEPIKETPAVAPIVAPIIVEEQPNDEEPQKVEEPPKAEEVPEKVEPKPEVVEQPKEEPKQEIVEEPQEKVYDFILNTNTHKYHDPNCRSVKKMSEKNKEYFTGTISEVKSRGFEPCEICQ